MALSPLMVIVDGPSCADPLEVVRAACAAGARLFQWRDKSASPRDFFLMGQQLAMVITAYRGTLIVNDRLDVALGLAAQGVHLPAHGMPARAVRALVGPDRIVGMSCHSHDELVRARHHASYVTFSPIWSPSSKPDEREALGARALEGAARAVAGVPVYALGGVTPERVAACLEQGASGVAVLGGICKAPDPYEATRAYVEALEDFARPHSMT